MLFVGGVDVCFLGLFFEVIAWGYVEYVGYVLWLDVFFSPSCPSDSEFYCLILLVFCVGLVCLFVFCFFGFRDLTFRAPS